MKKYLLAAFFLCSAFAMAMAQTPRAAYYENGQKKYQGNVNGDMKVGEWTFYFDSGQVQREGLYKEGKPYGVWTEYWKNGQVKSEGGYGISGSGESVRHGDWTWYHKNGAKHKAGEYRKGKKIGIWREFNTLGIEVKKVNLND